MKQKPLVIPHTNDLFRAWLDQRYGGDRHKLGAWHGFSQSQLDAMKAAYLAGYADAHTVMRGDHDNGK
jgi:hypothetical protein